MAQSRWLFLVSVVSIPFLAGVECPPAEDAYSLAQFRGDEPAPWQSFGYFNNICTERLCYPEHPDCSGTPDAFELRVPDPEARRRFVFLEGGCPGCTDTSPYFGPNLEFRTGGRYAYFEGPGEVRGLPLQWGSYQPLVGHIRSYERGECSASVTRPRSTSGGSLARGSAT